MTTFIGKVDVPAGSAVLAVWHAGKCYVVEATAAQIGEAGLVDCLGAMVVRLVRSIAAAEQDGSESVQ